MSYQNSPPIYGFTGTNTSPYMTLHNEKIPQQSNQSVYYQPSNPSSVVYVNPSQTAIMIQTAVEMRRRRRRMRVAAVLAIFTAIFFIIFFGTAFG